MVSSTIRLNVTDVSSTMCVLRYCKFPCGGTILASTHPCAKGLSGKECLKYSETRTRSKNCDSCKRRENKRIKDGLNDGSFDPNSLIKGRQAANWKENNQKRYHQKKLQRAREVTAAAAAESELTDNGPKAEAESNPEPVDGEGRFKSLEEDDEAEAMRKAESSDEDVCPELVYGDGPVKIKAEPVDEDDGMNVLEDELELPLEMADTDSYEDNGMAVVQLTTTPLK